MLRYKPSTKSMALARTKFGCFVFGLTLWASSISSFGQTASYHDHNIFHGAGTAFVNTSPAAQAVGDGGVLRAQLIWNVMPGQVKGADLDLHAKLPSGNGAYTVTAFDPVGVLPGTPQKTPPFGNPNTASDGNQQVNWVNRQVVFAGGRSVASLDQDNRTGIANSPSGSLVENIYIKGATAASPNNIPSGTYQFAVHNYNQTHLANPQTDYALWITTNGKVGVRSEGYYRGTGQDPANPGLPVYTGSLQNEGQSSNVYEVEIVNPDHDPHAAGVNVIDAKRRYLKDWQAEQALIAARKRAQAELYHQALLEKSRQVPVLDFQACPPPKVCQPDFSAYSAAPALIWTNPNQAVSAFLGHPYEPKKIDASAYQVPLVLSTKEDMGVNFDRVSINENYLQSLNLYGTTSVSTGTVISLGNFEQLSDIKSTYHRRKDGINDNNIKFTNNEGYEIVLRPSVTNSGTFDYVADQSLMGTYNYGTNFFTHTVLDVVPYWINGNTPNDKKSTSYSQRIFGQ